LNEDDPLVGPFVLVVLSFYTFILILLKNQMETGAATLEKVNIIEV